MQIHHLLDSDEDSEDNPKSKLDLDKGSTTRLETEEIKFDTGAAPRDSFNQEVKRAILQLIRNQELLQANQEQQSILLRKIQADTHDVVEAFKVLKAINTVLLWVGKIAKPLIFIASLVTFLVLYFKGIPAGVGK